MTDVEVRRFESKYVTDPNSGCWLWFGGRRIGYGLVRIKGKTLAAHRYSYTLYNGDIPEDKIILHICDTPCCVNPDHLRLGTHKDNSDDKHRKNRQVVLEGIKNGMSKLNPELVQEIRNKYIPRLYNIKMLAQEYSMSIATIHEIINFKIWKNI